MRRSQQRQVVVVTGATAGVGRAVVREFAARGAAVALIGRDMESLEAACAEVEACGGLSLALPLDVADAQAVNGAADHVESTLGPIDHWINNAMVTVVSPIDGLDASEVRRVTEVTYLGTVNGTLAALRHLLPRDRGSIVQVGSTLAYRSIPLQAPYCAAKAAVRGFTDSLRTELAHSRSRVRVSMVHLPAVNTPQFEWCRTHMPFKPRPVAPVFQPEVAARAIVWAAEHRRRELFVGGRTFAGIWLNRLAPGVLDRYLGRTGYKSQFRSATVDASRRDNLWEAPPGDRGAHGSFDGEAHSTSPALWLSLHRRTLGVAALGAGLLVAGAFAASRGSRGTAARSSSVRRALQG